MKKLFLLLLAGSMTFVSCKKDDDQAEPTPTIGPVPSSFTQKVLLEEFTGTWCGWCTDGADVLDKIVKANPNVAYGVSIHEGDVMEIPFYNDLVAVFANTSFPAGMVNRVPIGTDATLSRSSWTSATNTQKIKIAKCGLALESSISGATASVTVHCGFKEVLSGNYKLTVYIVEDHVTGGSSYSQQNYLYHDSDYITSPYFSQASPIVGYHHMQVVREVLTASLGDVIPASAIVVGTDYKVTYTGDITGYNSNNLKIVAFIIKAGTTISTREVMNVQQVKLGSLKDWN